MSSEASKPTSVLDEVDELAYLIALQEQDAKYGHKSFETSLDALVDGGLIDPPATSLRPWDEAVSFNTSRRTRLRSGRMLRRAQHGTLSMYTNRGCRCDDCREAARVHQEKLRRSKGIKAREYATHGSVSYYRKRGCRCDLCREASAAAAREYRAKKRAAA